MDYKEYTEILNNSVELVVKAIKEKKEPLDLYITEILNDFLHDVIQKSK